MFASRLLVILAPPIDAQSAQATVARAKAAAMRPALLRFALPASLREMAEDPDTLFYLGNEALEACVDQVTDETHFLLLSGAHAFAHHWDAALFSAIRSLSDKPTVLTGSITPGTCSDPVPSISEDTSTVRLPKINPGGLNTLRQSLPEIRRRRAGVVEEEAHPPEVCLPSLKESLDDENVYIGRGLPLVCSAGPVSTLLIDPAFLFGPVRFLFENSLSLSTLSLAAYLTGWRCCVPDTPYVWPIAELPRRILSRPSAEAMPGSTLSRFEQLLGFHYGHPIASAKAMLGLFGPEDTYPQRMGRALKLNQKAYAFKQQLMEVHMPLLVTAFVDLPAPRHPVPFYLLRFGFLKNVASLPLLMYTGGEQERQLRAAYPNTQSYPDNALLPRTLLAEGMTPQQHFLRSKPLLLLRAARRHEEFTHFAWLDMDILPHPVCADAMPDLESLADDRIHLATVGGVPDGSFILIPRKYLSAIAREVQSITLLDAELKRGFSEELLWERLFIKKPEWFCIHPMPRRRLLFLSLFDQRLLSQSLRAVLKDLPKPFLGTAADGRRAATRTPKPFKE
ncbi:MAG: hypothetical protein IJ354_04540 [Clostridia bacterium]|nr:hypothetical protein [Clostridia bacterium]